MVVSTFKFSLIHQLWADQEPDRVQPDKQGLSQSAPRARAAAKRMTVNAAPMMTIVMMMIMSSATVS